MKRFEDVESGLNAEGPSSYRHRKVCDVFVGVQENFLCVDVFCGVQYTIQYVLA